MCGSDSGLVQKFKKLEQCFIGPLPVVFSQENAEKISGFHMTGLGFWRELAF